MAHLKIMIAGALLLGIFTVACDRRTPPTEANSTPVQGELIGEAPLPLQNAPPADVAKGAGDHLVTSAATGGAKGVAEVGGAGDHLVTSAATKGAKGVAEAGGAGDHLVTSAATKGAKGVAEAGGAGDHLVTSAATGGAKGTNVSKTAAATDYDSVTFDKLASFNFEMTEQIVNAGSDTAGAKAKSDSQIPAKIKEFNKKRVALQGFMLPLKVEGGAVTEFLIMRDQSMCCYGTIPKINEWVSVKMVGGGVKPTMDQAVTIYGTLHVGEMRENGYLVGIYSMDGDKLGASSN